MSFVDSVTESNNAIVAGRVVSDAKFDVRQDMSAKMDDVGCMIATTVELGIVRDVEFTINVTVGSRGICVICIAKTGTLSKWLAERSVAGIDPHVRASSIEQETDVLRRCAHAEICEVIRALASDQSTPGGSAGGFHQEH